MESLSLLYHKNTLIISHIEIHVKKKISIWDNLYIKGADKGVLI